MAEKPFLSLSMIYFGAKSWRSSTLLLLLSVSIPTFVQAEFLSDVTIYTGKQETKMMQELNDARPVVEAEVRKSLGWSPEQFTLEAREFDATTGILIIAVVHVDDLRRPIPGGGKSWRVDFDTRHSTIVRWLKYQ